MLKTHTQHTIIMFTNVDIRQRWIKGPGKKFFAEYTGVTKKLQLTFLPVYDKKLSYRRVTARCVLSVVILPITTQQCRNYLYNKS